MADRSIAETGGKILSSGSDPVSAINNPGVNLEISQEQTHHDELELIFNMFGNDKARGKFKELLDVYREVYLKHRAADVDGARRAEFGRSGTHNDIMYTFQQLALSAKPGSREEEVLRKMADRNTTHEYIRDWSAFEDRGRHKSELQRFREKGIHMILPQ